MDPNGKIRSGIDKAQYKYPLDIDSQPIVFSISLKPYGFFGDTNIASGPADNIYLPMPTKGLVDDYKIDYDNQAMGAIGGIATTALNGGSVLGGLGSGLALFGKSIVGSYAEQLGDVAGMAKQAGAATDLAAGFINNPNIAILFKGVKPRDLEFTWNMVARNKKEAEQIRDITTLIKKHSLPEKQFGANFALNYPSIAHLAVLGPEKKERYITFSEMGAFVTSVSVNYGGAGHAAFFKDGNPTNVTLTVGFRERNIITQDDIVQG